MLPSKKELRTTVRQKATPKWASRYFDCYDSKDYVAEYATKIVSHQKVLCIFWYSKESQGNTYISYISKDGDCLTRTAQSPINWYKSFPFYLSCISKNKHGNYWYIQSNVEAAFKYFGEKIQYPETLLYNKVSNFKRKEAAVRDKANKKKTFEMWEDLPALPKNFKNWCKKQFGNIIFDTVTEPTDEGLSRHNGYCTCCNTHSHYDSKLISGHSYKCPHCGAASKAVSKRQVTTAYSCHSKHKCFAVAETLGDNIVVRHFDVERDIHKDLQATYNYFEYERDVISEDRKQYCNYIMRTSTYGNDYWSTNKPYQGYHLFLTLPDRYYKPERIYTDNLAEILESKGISSCKSILVLAKNTEQRLEDLFLSTDEQLQAAEVLYKDGFKSLCYTALYSSELIQNGSNTSANIIGLNKEWREYIKENSCDIREIKIMRKQFAVSQKLKEYVKLKTIAAKCSYYSNYFDVDCQLDICKNHNITIPQMYKYFKPFLNLRNGEFRTMFTFWKDYLRMYKKCMDTEHMEYPKRWKFPSLKSIKQIHDETMAWLNSIKDKIKAEKRKQNEIALKSLVDKLSKIDSYSIDGMVMVLPHTYNDFVTEGTKQGICVGNGAYFESMAQGKSVIVFMRNKENAQDSYCTIEFGLNDGKVVLKQCKLYKNKTATDNDQRIAEKYGKILQKQLALSRVA